MDQSVIIKSNKYGLVVLLDAEKEFSGLLKDIGQKFKESANFFKNSQMALAFEGRDLSDEEERQILDVITDNSDIQVLCIIDKNEMREQYFKQKVDERMEEMSATGGQFYKGTLRSGQLLESETSIIILGDVNPGANVVAKGNVVVLGSLKGTVYAGAAGNDACFVTALYMNPMQIRIGDYIARSPDKLPARQKRAEKKNEPMDPKIAFVEEGNIYIEPLNKDVIGDIRL